MAAPGTPGRSSGKPRAGTRLAHRFRSGFQDRAAEATRLRA
jgi:hypothetical protein